MTLQRMLVVGLCVFAAFTGCGPAPRECEFDADCPEDEYCSSINTCVLCTQNSHCSDDAFCCNGECIPNDDIEQHCGCAADVTDNDEGQSCSGTDNLCIVDIEEQLVRATRASVSDGVCGCPCSADAGGTVCQIDTASDDGYSCGCERTDPIGTCERPAIGGGNLHIVADTCSPSGACLCLASGVACDPTSSQPDCTADGCVNVLSDVDSCGVSARSCTDAASGMQAGQCIEGGCQCDAAADCQGDGLNVDTCVVIAGPGQCVCDGYQADGERAACPLALPCTAEGCVYEGTGYATSDDLYRAIGVQ